MSKNMTRKGLAIGAGLALIGSGFVALPAQANATLYLEPLAGTEYTMIEGETFTLRAGGDANFVSANGSQLRVMVQNKTASHQFTGFAVNGTALDNDYSSTSTGNMILFTGATAPATDANVTAAAGTLATVGSAVDSTAVMGLGASSDSATVAASVSAMTSPFTFSFTSGSVANGTTAVLEVTVWQDVNNNGVMDSGELKSPTRSVTFIGDGDLRATITGGGTSGTSGLWVGQTTSAFAMSLGAVNEALVVASDFALNIQNNAGTPAEFAGSTNATDYRSVSLNAAKTHLVTANLTAGGSAALGNTGWTALTAQAKYKSDGITFSSGVVVTASAGADINAARTTLAVNAVSQSAANTTAYVVRGANAIETSAGNADVRRNTAFEVELETRDGSTPSVTLAGIAATITVSASPTLSTTKFVTVDGVAYTTSAALAAAVISKATGSDGTAKVSILPTGFAADETITVTFVSQGQTDAVVTTQKNAVYTMNFVDGNEGANEGYDPSIAPGGTLSEAIAVADQWGIAPANGTYSVSVARATAVARTTAASWSYVVPVVSGVATVNITDNGTGTGSDTVTATLIGAAASATTVSFGLTYSTTAAVAGLTLTDNWDGTTQSTVRLNAKTVGSYHPYLSNGADAPVVTNNFVNSALTGTSNATLTVSGVVTNASNLAVEGVPVTLSAKGVTFAFTDGNSKTIFSRDSIVVPSSGSGTYSVAVYSDATGGTVTITAAVGTLSRTTSVTFVGGAASDFTIAAPASSAAGRTADVIVTAKDKNGNVVSGATVTLSSTGPGYLINTTGTTLSDGTFATKLLLGANDTGVAVIKVTMTIAGVSTTKTASIAVGTGAASGAGKVNVGSFNGKLVVYASGLSGKTISWKVGGTWGKQVAASNYAVFNRPTPRAGVTVSVNIYVDGVLTLTKSVVTR